MTRIALPPVVDLKAATALADTLRGIAGPITLDGAAVDRIGIAGLQLLLSARATADVTGQALVIEAPSAALAGAAATAGAAFLFQSAR